MQDDHRQGVSEARYDGRSGGKTPLSSYIANMTERIRKIFQRTPSYQPLLEDEEGRDGQHNIERDGSEFSWIDYSIFLLIGVSMLWAW